MSSMSEAEAAAGRRSRTPSADVERELVSAAEAVLVRAGPGALTVRAVAAWDIKVLRSPTLAAPRLISRS